VERGTPRLARIHRQTIIPRLINPRKKKGPHTGGLCHSHVFHASGTRQPLDALMARCLGAFCFSTPRRSC
jgi:hypothetical protein